MLQRLLSGLLDRPETWATGIDVSFTTKKNIILKLCFKSLLVMDYSSRELGYGPALPGNDGSLGWVGTIAVMGTRLIFLV